MRTDFVWLTRRGVIAGSVAMLSLTGCGSLLGPSGPPPQIYRLDPVLPAWAAGSNVSWQLAVARPAATQTLDTERIALMRGVAMDYYADAQWNDSVPRLVQSLLIEAFERSGRILAVARESDGVRPDYTLETEIRDFDAQYATENSAPTVVVDIMARLLGQQGSVVASHEVKQSAPAAANNVASVVGAFDQALGAALAQIVTWTLQLPPVRGESR
jgi:cholesterol transport system auxiliary component